MIDWTKARSVELAWDDGHTPASLQVVQEVPTATNLSNDGSAHQQDERKSVLIGPHHQEQQQLPNGVGTDIEPPIVSLLPSLPKKVTPTTATHQFLRWYPDFHCLEREAVYRIDDALDSTLLDDIYTYTTRSEATTPTWGTYVTMKEIRAYWSNHNHHTAPNDNDPRVATASTTQDDDDDYQHQLALAVAADFVRHAIVGSSSPSTPIKHESSTSSTTVTCALLSPTSTDTTSAASPLRVPLWTERDCGDPNDDTTHHHLLPDPKVDGATTLPTTAAHGVAVWCLSAAVGSHVPYHMDYAELIRYETGVTVPPVLAGTIHCSRLVGREVDDPNDNADDADNDDETSCAASAASAAAAAVMVGGDYMVRTTSPSSTPSDDLNNHSDTTTTMASSTETPIVLDHYRTHGYKSILSSGAAYTESETDPSGGTHPHWIRIPYRYNRMICQSGHLPHLSTRIRSIKVRHAAATTSDSRRPTATLVPCDTCPKRVVVGLNVFLHDVGPAVQQAPEHSEAFRRRVQRATPTTQTLNGSDNTKGQGRRHGGLSLAHLVANPQLSRRLVQAKREQYQRDYIAAQEALYERIREFLSKPSQSIQPKSDSLPSSNMVPVHQLLTALAPTVTAPPHRATRMWPVTTSDIHVYLHRQWQNGRLVCARYGTVESTEQMVDEDSNVQHELTPVLPSIDQKGLIETNWLIGLSANAKNTRLDSPVVSSDNCLALPCV